MFNKGYENNCKLGKINLLFMPNVTNELLYFVNFLNRYIILYDKLKFHRYGTNSQYFL